MAFRLAGQERKILGFMTKMLHRRTGHSGTDWPCWSIIDHFLGIVLHYVLHKLLFLRGQTGQTGQIYPCVPAQGGGTPGLSPKGESRGPDPAPGASALGCTQSVNA